MHSRKLLRFENACPKSGVYPPHTYRGPQNHHFRLFCNLTATLTAYIFGTKHDMHNRQVHWLQGVSDIMPKRHEFMFHKRLQTGPPFLPTLFFVFYFIARLRRRTPANGTQPNFAKRWTVNRALTICRRTVAVVPRKKLGAKNLYIFFGFSRT